jgi:predicted nucleotidyltransferase component of viral defense system
MKNNMLHIQKHRQILFNLITDIYKSPAGTYVGFKGGTMLYFFHELDRFSVDLDFDLLDDGQKDLVYDTVKSILQKYGTIKDEAEKNYNIFFLLNYEEGEHSIKVEISKRTNVHNRYEMKNFYGTDVRVLTLEDAFAHKLVACTERKRTANRDHYDIFFFLKKGVNINEKIIMDRTGKDLISFLLFLREHIANKRSRAGMLEGLGELVDDDQKKWVKNDLKNELLGMLDFVIEQKKGSLQ